MELENGKSHIKSRIFNARILSEWIREKEKTKRVLIIVVFLLVIISAVTFVFAPKDRQYIAYIVGGILLILAFGAIGVYQFVIKLPGIDLRSEGNKELAKDEGQEDDSFLGAEEEVFPIPADSNKSSNKTDAGDGK